jgi:hypothetical protein
MNDYMQTLDDIAFGSVPTDDVLPVDAPIEDDTRDALARFTLMQACAMFSY